MDKNRIVFMGTPDFACPALDRLITTGHAPIAVYTQPPRPAGRGQRERPSPVHQLAKDHNIPVHTPLSFKKNADAVRDFQALNADLAIVAAYGLILPEIILNAPRLGCINIHASLLPRWRGASPIQHAVWKGDDKTGITLMQMERGLDTGPMIARSECPITSDTTAAILHDELAQMGADLLLETLPDLETITPAPQDDALSTYAPMLSKADGCINWSQPAEVIDRQIRALTPWPGTWTIRGDQRLKILAAKPVNEGAGQAGVVTNAQGDVTCGTGTIRLERVQPEGKKAMSITDAINGGYLLAGDTLS